MKFERYRLQEYLEAQNLAQDVSLPWFHSTKAGRLFDILNKGHLLAMPCNVFTDDLCYFFVGRPAYKYTLRGDPKGWMLPMVFVMKFDDPPPIKRIYPFDSGAFTEKRFPDYIQTFDRERFLLGTDHAAVSRLIEYYFDNNKGYVQRVANSSKDIGQKHAIDGRHDEIMALAELYQESNSTDMDDRAATVEIQVEGDVPLSSGNVLGVIICEERLNTEGVREALLEMTPNIMEYSLYPNNLASYYGAIAQRTMDLYRKLGILA